MKTLPLQWFTDTQVLTELGRELLARLFNQFRDELAYGRIYPPNPQSNTPYYFGHLATLLKSSERWPADAENRLALDAGNEHDLGMDSQRLHEYEDHAFFCMAPPGLYRLR